MELSCTSSSDFRYQNDLNSKIALHMQMSAITNSRTFRLFFLLFVYSIVGAAIFLSLESKYEQELLEKRRNWIDRKRAELQHKIFSQNYSKSASSILKSNREKTTNFSGFRDELRSNMWKNRTRDILIWYENLMDNLRKFDGNGLTSEFYSMDQNFFWTFRNSIVFCLTIFSTTGFRSSKLQTFTGRILVIILWPAGAFIFFYTAARLAILINKLLWSSYKSKFRRQYQELKPRQTCNLFYTVIPCLVIFFFAIYLLFIHLNLHNFDANRHSNCPKFLSSAATIFYNLMTISSDRILFSSECSFLDNDFLLVFFTYSFFMLIFVVVYQFRTQQSTLYRKIYDLILVEYDEILFATGLVDFSASYYSIRSTNLALDRFINEIWLQYDWYGRFLYNTMSEYDTKKLKITYRKLLQRKTNWTEMICYENPNFDSENEAIFEDYDDDEMYEMEDFGYL